MNHTNRRHFLVPFVTLVLIVLLLSSCTPETSSNDLATPTLLVTSQPTLTENLLEATTIPQGPSTRLSKNEEPPSFIAPTPEPISPDQLLQEIVIDHALPLDQIPSEIIKGNVSIHPDFSRIPVFSNLRQELSAQLPAEKWDVILKFIGLLGVQTLENGTLDGSNVPRWNTYTAAGQRVLTCNTYATTLLRAMGLTAAVSHWIDPQTHAPAFNQGIELQARDTHRWLQEYGPEYGWSDVSGLTPEERLDLLADGYIILGANDIHMWVIFGVPLGNRWVPVVTQSIPNTIAMIAYYPTQFDSPESHTLFAHEIP